MTTFQKFKKSKLFKPLLTFLGVVFFILLWWLIAALINSTLFPDPWTSFGATFTLLSKGNTYKAIGGTFLRLLISFGISFICALIFGIIAGVSSTFKTFFNPFVTVFRTIPTAAIIFILIVLVNSSVSTVVVSFLLMFPILYEAVASGVSSIDKTIIDALEIDQKKTHINSIINVIIPMSFPHIILGIVQSLGLGLKVTIMSEVLTGDTSIPGLGRLLRNASSEADMEQIFAIAIISIIIITLLDTLVKIIKNKFFKK